MKEPPSILPSKHGGLRSSRRSSRHGIVKVHRKLIDTIAGPGENLSIPPIKSIAVKCKHPQVRVVARDEDTEFVECQHCGEVFDAIEYRDMILEEEEAGRAGDEAV
jgi:hypothetical protein